ncbi:MAG: hypothetical protein MHM6MM_000707 [Cercozoa sp. M6MM]
MTQQDDSNQHADDKSRVTAASAQSDTVHVQVHATSPQLLEGRRARTPSRSSTRSFYIDANESAESIQQQKLPKMAQSPVRISKKDEAFVYQGKSTVFRLPINNFVRRMCINVVDTKTFDFVILFIIVANSVIIALDNPIEEKSDAFKSFLRSSDIFFAAAFALEMLVKVIAMGMWCNGKYAYLRDSWNVLDFIVVVLGGVSLFIESNFTVVRTVRVLRPLRTINSIESMRRLIASLLDALHSMRDVAIFLAFIMFLFALVGMQFFGGRLRMRCVVDSSGDILAGWEDYVCRLGAERLSSPSTNGTEPSLGSSVRCPSDTTCMKIASNPDGIVGFDNLGQSALTILTSASLEGWVDNMYLTWQATTHWATIFWVLLVIVVSFFSLNLIMGVIYNSYNTGRDEVQREVEEREEIKRRRDSIQQLAVSAFITAGKKRGEEEESKAISAVPSEIPSRSVSASARTMTPSRKTRIGPAIPEESDLEGTDEWLVDTPAEIQLESVSDGISMAEREQLGNVAALRRRIESEAKRETDIEQENQIDSIVRTITARARRRSSIEADIPSAVAVDVAIQEDTPGFALEIRGLEQQHEAFLAKKEKVATWRERLQPFMKSERFDRFITGLIITNTILLATEYYGQPDWWETTLDVTNGIFTWIFFCEITIKFIALGKRRFWKDKFNRFDLIVTLATCIEFIVSNASTSGSSSTISMLRVLRLLRVFKLANRWPALARLLEVVLSAFSSLSSFSLILLLFTFIYALLGMQLFAGRLKCGESACRINFDSFWWSIVTVFIVIGSENWNDNLANAMQSTGWISSLYFLSLYILGNLILLSLFLAILLSQFEEADEEEEKRYEEELQEKLREVAEVEPRQSEELSDEPSSTLEEFEPSSESEFDSTEQESAPFGVQETPESAANAPSRVDSVSGRLPMRRRLTPLNIAVEHAVEDETAVTSDSDAAEKPKSKVEEITEQDASVKPSGPVHRPSSPTPKDELAAPKKTKGLKHLPSSLAELTQEQRAGVMFELARMHTPSDSKSRTKKNRRRRRKPRSDQLESQTHSRSKSSSSSRASEESFESKKSYVSAASSAAESVANAMRFAQMHNSLRCFSPRSRVRRLMLRLVGSPKFDQLIMLLIIVTAFLLAFETPSLDTESHWGRFLYWFNVAATAVFSIEAIGRIIALGFFMHEGAYLRNGWNTLDFVVVVVSVVEIVVSSSVRRVDVSSLRALKALRAFRALRMLSRFPRLRVVVQAIIFALPTVSHVIAVALLFYVVFSILAIQLFAGKFGQCVLQAGADWSALEAAGATLSDVGNSIVAWNKDSCDAATQIGLGVIWENPKFGSFDTVFSSLLLLFEVSTLEMWPDMLLRAVDVTGVEQAPERDNAPYYAVFFIAFIIVGNFFIVNLFVSVVIDTFSAKQAEFNGLRMLTPAQQAWLEAKQLLLHVDAGDPRFFPPGVHAKDGFDELHELGILLERINIFDEQDRNWHTDAASSESKDTGPEEAPSGRLSPSALQLLDQDIGFWRRHVTGWRPKLKRRYLILRVRRAVFNLVTTERFEVGIAILICLNVIVMAMWTSDMSSGYDLALELTNAVLTWLFVLEAVLKIIGLGPRQYIASAWNCFDFVIVAGGVLGFFLELPFGSDSTSMPVDPTLLRVFRAGRLLRLVKRLNGLQRLVRVVVMSLPQVINICALMLLLFFVFAVIGMQLFGGLPRDGDFINEHAHFDNILMAMVTLFRCATGESWNGIMHDARTGSTALDSARCVEVTSLDDIPGGATSWGPRGVVLGSDGLRYARNCGSTSAYAFFVLFTVFCGFIMVELFVAVILQHFEQMGTAHSGSSDADGESAAGIVQLDDVIQFSHAWSRYAPQRHWWKWWDQKHLWIRANALPAMLSECGGTLGIRDRRPRLTPNEVIRFVDALNVPVFAKPTFRSRRFDRLRRFTVLRSFGSKLRHARERLSGMSGIKARLSRFSRRSNAATSVAPDERTESSFSTEEHSQPSVDELKEDNETKETSPQSSLKMTDKVTDSIVDSDELKKLDSQNRTQTPSFAPPISPTATRTLQLQDRLASGSMRSHMEHKRTTTTSLFRRDDARFDSRSASGYCHYYETLVALSFFALRQRHAKIHNEIASIPQTCLSHRFLQSNLRRKFGQVEMAETLSLKRGSADEASIGGVKVVSASQVAAVSIIQRAYRNFVFRRAMWNAAAAAASSMMERRWSRIQRDSQLTDEEVRRRRRGSLAVLSDAASAVRRKAAEAARRARRASTGVLNRNLNVDIDALRNHLHRGAAVDEFSDSSSEVECKSDLEDTDICAITALRVVPTK